MTAIRSRNRSFKMIAALGMILVMAFTSACDILATEGARDAIANGREIRAFEDETLRPIENEMNDLWVNEIQPRETELEDLRQQMRTIEEEVMSPLWDAQNDMWAPGGAASEAQAAFDARYREVELLERALQVEQRELDESWQNIWNGDNSKDPEYQALEDLRYEKQRDLERLYRFGYRPVDDIWDQINELNSAQGWANTDIQIEAEQYNIELRRLYDLQADIQNNGNDEANQLYDRAVEAQEQLNDLHNFGWNPINEIWAEIEQLENERNNTTTTAGNTESIAAQIADLQAVRASYVLSRDNELAALRALLETLDSTGSTSTSDDGVVDNSERIAELEAIIVGLENDADALKAAKRAEIDTLNDTANAKQVASEQAVVELTNAFEASLAVLLADGLAIDEEIAGIQFDADGAAEQISALQLEKQLLLAQEEAEEVALGVAISQVVSDREADVAAIDLEIDAIEALINDGLTNEIDGWITEHKAELESLRSNSRSDDTTSPPATTQSAADVLASIDASGAHWNGLIDEITNKILALENEQLIGSSSSTDDGIDARINNLRLQAVELERALNSKISELEALINELYRQADNVSSGDTGQFEEIQSQIDALNDKLELIWQQESSNGLEVLRQVQQLEKQARALEEENEQATRLLEEEVWDLDDKLSLYHRDQETVRQAAQDELQAISDDMQQRRHDLEEQRWAIDAEQRVVFDEIEVTQNEAHEQIRLIEEQEFGKVRGQIRELEEELRTFYAQQRELENAMRDAQMLVEEKQRELEDEIFDALESAAGTVDEAGETVLTATEETGPEFDEVTPESQIDEGVSTPTSSAN